MAAGASILPELVMIRRAPRTLAEFSGGTEQNAVDHESRARAARFVACRPRVASLW